MTRWMIVAAALLLMGQAPAGIGCPPAHDGKPLENIQLFDGDPAQLMDLAPEKAGWPLDPPTTYYLLRCLYAGTAAPVDIKLPPHVRYCRFAPARPKVRCD